MSIDMIINTSVTIINSELSCNEISQDRDFPLRSCLGSGGGDGILLCHQWLQTASKKF